MLKKENLKKIFSNDYPGYNAIVTEVISPIFGEDFNYLSDPEDLRIGDEAEASKIISVKRIGTIYDKNNIGRDTIEVLDITVSDSVRLDRKYTTLDS